MGTMRRVVPLALVLVPAWLTFSTSVRRETPASDKNEIERGRYLAEEVAKCAPRNAQEELEQDA